MNFFAENLKVFKQVFFPLFILVVLSSNVDQYLTFHIDNSLRDPHGAQREVYVLGFISIISGIVFPVILMTVALFALNKQIGWTKDLGEFAAKNLSQIFIETLRSWGKALLWSLVFILPGLWKYLQYTFVPVVVTSSSSYDEGNEDALARSAQIFQKHWGKVLGVFFAFHIFAPLVLVSVFDGYRYIWKTPFSSLTLSLLDTYLIIISTHILFNIFRSEVQKHDAYV